MRKILILTLACICLFSCKKKHTLKVTVTNVGTGKPMSNNGVYITELTNKVGSMGGGTVTHDFYSGITNENGELYITKRFDRRYTYEVSVDLPDNWAYVEDVSYTMANGDKYWKNGINFKIATAAYLKQDIVNVNCEGVTDTFSIRDKYTYTDWTAWTNLAGCFSNTGGGYSKVPAGTRIFQWKVVRTSGTTTGADTVVFSEGSYETLTIHY